MITYSTDHPKHGSSMWPSAITLVLIILIIKYNKNVGWWVDVQYAWLSLFANIDFANDSAQSKPKKYCSCSYPTLVYHDTTIFVFHRIVNIFISIVGGQFQKTPMLEPHLDDYRVTGLYSPKPRVSVIPCRFKLNIRTYIQLSDVVKTISRESRIFFFGWPNIFKINIKYVRIYSKHSY